MTTLAAGASPLNPDESGPDKLHAHDSAQVFQAARDQYILDRAAPASPAVNNTLPRDTAAFIGRDTELQALTAAVARYSETSNTIPIHVIDGMPGVGKTALAIHAAHRLAKYFPDGQLWVDLHAHSANQGPVEPSDQLFRLLSADGMAPEQVPATLDERAARWRARMAGRRIILIMDDADSLDQVEHLLPGAAGCLVLITSRHRLIGLGARHGAVPLSLGTLPPDEAAGLFARLAGRERTGAVDELVRLCGYLPLAISLLATKLKLEPLWTVEDRLADMAATRDRLSHLEARDIAVAAAFDLSYCDLPSAPQRFFRRLGLHPGVDIDVYAAAALDGISVAEARRHLDSLYQDHLLDQPAWGRYRMHDLVAEYTRALVDEESVGCDEAVARLLDYYQYAAGRADRHISTRLQDLGAEPETAVPQFRGLDDAMSWMRTELPNLLACVAYAGQRELDARVVSLAAVLAAFLRRRCGSWQQAISLHQSAAAAAQRIGDPHARAVALLHASAHLRRTGDYALVMQALNEVLTIQRDLDDGIGLADVFSELGTTYRLTSNFRAAKAAFDRALISYRALGDDAGEAAVLTDLAVVLWLTEDYTRAQKVLHRALKIYDRRGDRLGRATALFNLGVVRRLTSNYPGALEVLDEALATYVALEHRLGEANTRHNLGLVRIVTADYSRASEELRRAFEIYSDLGDRLGQAHGLRWIGAVARLTGDYVTALETLRAAVAQYASLESPHGMAGALLETGIVHRLAGNLAEAAAALRKALTIYREVGSHLGEAEALSQVGTLLLQRGRPRQARMKFEAALSVARSVASSLEEARALDGIGLCALRLRDVETAVEYLGRALRIYEQIGAPEAVSAAANIASLTG